MSFAGPFDLTLSGDTVYANGPGGSSLSPMAPPVTPFTLGGSIQTVYPGSGGSGTSRIEYSGLPLQGLNLGPVTAAYDPGAGFFEGAVAGGPESVTGAISGPGTPSLGGNGSATGGTPGASPGYSGGLTLGGITVGGNLPSGFESQGPVVNFAQNTLGIAPAVTQAAMLSGSVPGNPLAAPLAGLNLVNTVGQNISNFQMAQRLNENAMRNNAVPLTIEESSSLPPTELSPVQAAIAAAQGGSFAPLSDANAQAVANLTQGTNLGVFGLPGQYSLGPNGTNLNQATMDPTNPSASNPANFNNTTNFGRGANPDDEPATVDSPPAVPDAPPDESATVDSPPGGPAGGPSGTGGVSGGTSPNAPDTTEGGPASTGPVGGDGGGGGGSTVICTALFRRGYLDEATYRADQAFGRAVERDVYAGYMTFGPRVAKLIDRSAIVARLVSLVALPWAREMAYRMDAAPVGNSVGRLIMAAGIPLCRWLARRKTVAAEVSA